MSLCQPIATETLKEFMNFLTLKIPSNGNRTSMIRNAIDYGTSKNNGGHNHQTNRGDDLTPAQKAGHIQAGKTKAEKKNS